MKKILAIALVIASMGITANTLPDGAEFKLTSLSPTTSGSGIF